VSNKILIANRGDCRRGAAAAVKARAGYAGVSRNHIAQRAAIEPRS